MKKKTTKIGRNDPCPCGSQKKYKRCCGKMGKIQDSIEESNYARQHGIRLKTKADIEMIRQAGRLALETLDKVEAMIQPGITTDNINTVVHEHTLAAGATPAPLNYRGFPKSVCVSINDVICHGIPGPRKLKQGDIVNVDVTPILNGYYADANKMFIVGTPVKEAQKIVRVARQSLKAGIDMVQPGNTIGDIGWAIQELAEGEGCSVVREFVGHGVGFDFHEPPQVPHFGRRKTGVQLIPGMVFTIEPMINLGERHLKILEDQWTAITADGSLSAQFEQTVVVTETGVESLTPFDL